MSSGNFIFATAPLGTSADLSENSVNDRFLNLTGREPMSATRSNVRTAIWFILFSVIYLGTILFRLCDVEDQ